MRRIINRFTGKISAILGTYPLRGISNQLSAVGDAARYIMIDDYLRQHLFENPRYVSSKRVTHHHRSVYTQNGEDGIIEEIFRRIGVTNKFFVEFGVHGIKNNSTFLLVKQWKGLWLGAADKNVNARFNDAQRVGSLTYKNAWITTENIQELFKKNHVPQKPDLLSIDLDGNDYWIWKTITEYQPRVVIIEYNAAFPPEVKWVMRYNPEHRWDQTNYFGASLKSLELLGAQKGYKLVGTDFFGCNAFFVHESENLSLFEAPFTSENHYEPARYSLKLSSGHRPGFGPFEVI